VVLNTNHQQVQSWIKRY